jgi:glutamyl-tRNA(Gln) amidotransferase subunit D
MYSSIIEGELGKKGISVGDEVKIEKKGKTYSGTLMPRIGLGDQNSLVIKLKSGYNVGIAFEKGTGITLVGKGKRPAHGEKKGAEGTARGKISILGCGGTIASKVEYRTGAVFPAFSPEEILSSFPSLKELAEIRGKFLFSILSEDMTSAHWQIIANSVAEEINDGAKGVVLMHGTDTMGYTGAALSFMLQNLPVPVVLVGAQRSSDRGSSDNEMNLFCSVLAAKSDIAHVGVCMHADMGDLSCYLHNGTKVRKMHTSRRDAFQSINALPLARIYYNEKTVEPLVEKYNKRDEKRKLLLNTKMNGNVALIWIHPGIKPSFMESLSSYDGIVLAGTGLGHVPSNPFNDKHAKSIIPSLKGLVERGIAVAIAPQTIYGRIDTDVYTAGRMLNEIGVIGNHCDWLPETAFVKLMFALGQTKDQKKVREIMLADIAGEISKRSVVL